MTKVKKSDLIKARILWYILRLIDNLNSITDDEEFEISYCSIYPKKLELAKENTDKDVTSFGDLDIKIWDVNLKLASSIKEIHFLFHLLAFLMVR